jgi:hypothetical protein
MKTMKAILNVLLLSCVFLLLVSCDKENNPQDSQLHIHTDTNKISFEDFLDRVKIKKIDLNIISNATTSVLQRRAEDEIEFTGFLIDTTTVKQFVREDVITFTLPVIPNPYPNNENFYYNIVFYKVDSIYQWSILEYEKRFDERLVKEILNETTNNDLVDFSRRIYTTWSTGPIYHCTNTGPCADGPCDNCSLCVSTGTIMGSIEIPDYQFASIEQAPGSLLNGGGNAPSFSSSLVIAINNFKNTLSPAQLAVYNLHKVEFDNYLKNNSRSFVDALGASPTTINPRAQQFGKELCDILNQLEYSSFAEQQEIVRVLIITQQYNYFENPFDINFFQSADNVSSTNLIDPVTALNFARLFSAHYAIVKQENPSWSKTKIFAQAWLDTMQLLLDFVGLAPGLGEVADIANGTIYLIQGNHTDATLSYLSAIPVAGWYTAGIKFAKRTISLSSGAKTSLKWIVNAQEIIKFGDRKQLRKVLQLAVGDARQAHHIIPWGKSAHPAVQKAASSNNAFHMNEALNGIPVNTTIHNGSHSVYDGLVQSRLDAIPANATPDEAYEEVLDIINDIRAAIQNNPGVPLNQLIF